MNALKVRHNQNVSYKEELSGRLQWSGVWEGPSSPTGSCLSFDAPKETGQRPTQLPGLHATPQGRGFALRAIESH